MKHFLVSSFFLVLVLCTFAEAGVRRANRNNAGTLVVGGRPAVQGEVPYIISIRNILDGNEHECAATLAEVDGVQFAIGAASCIFNYASPFYVGVAGEVDFSNHTGTEKSRPLFPMVHHPDFSDRTLVNNIMIMFFIGGPFETSDDIQPVALPTQGQNATGNLKVSGWGAQVYEGPRPIDVLHTVDIPIVNDTYCQEVFENSILPVNDDMLCVGTADGEVSPCHADLGGPGISDDGYLAGVVSWNDECGQLKHPAIFTEVSHYVDWIHETVRRYKNSL